MRRLVINKISNVCFSIIADDDAVGISFSKEAKGNNNNIIRDSVHKKYSLFY
jgi:hypothetical protein